MVNPQSGDTPENKPDPAEREESVAERSARLEAEAQALYNKAQEDAEADIEAYESYADQAEPETQDKEQSLKHEESNHLAAQVEALQAELAQTKDKMLRVAAEAENTKRRALKDRDDAGKFAIQGFARDLVNVADNLRRALDAMPDDLKEDVRVANLAEGIEATERELLRSFEKNGIAKVDPKGQVFDPNFHEVMFEAPVPGQPAGTIIEVIETGYTLHGRILRPARVGVAKDDGSGGAPAQPDPNADPGSNFDGEA